MTSFTSFFKFVPVFFILLSLDETSTPLDDEIDRQFVDYEYDPNLVITRVISLEQLKREDELHEKAVYYLNDEQYSCLQTNNQPVFILGSAGSGKTTINVHKAFILAKKPQRIGYFTYSNYLVEDAKKLFHQIEMEYDEPFSEEARKRVEFYNLMDYLQLNSSTKQLMKAPEFITWVVNSHPQKLKLMNVSPHDVYKEIRGILKGLIPKDWVTLQLDVKEEYLSEERLDEFIKRRYVSLINGAYQLNTKRIYEAKKRYMDQVDLQIVALWHRQLNEYLVQNPYLSDVIYYQLDEQYCAYDLKTRQLMYEILLSYEAYLHNHQRCDENDLSRQRLTDVMQQHLPLFDYIIVDEIQDLTEIEVYLLMQLLKNKNHLHMSGDFNQTIRPTYFHPGRIESLLKTANYHHEFEQHLLIRNYRSAASIVEFANEVVSLRVNRLKRNKQNDYAEVAMRLNKAPIFYLAPSGSNVEAILKTGLKRHYVGIVTPNEQTKKQLDQWIQAKGALYTVEEIKGIEKEYIICYNVMSSFYETWEHIFTSTDLSLAMYRYVFNVLYVALTRARTHICFIEENMPPHLYHYLSEYFTEVLEYDATSLHLNVTSSFDQFFQEAKKLERRELYEQAIAAYSRSEQLDVNRHISRCEGLMLLRDGKTYEAASTFLSTHEYELAIPLLQRQKRHLQWFEAMIKAKWSYPTIQRAFEQEALSVLSFVQSHEKKITVMDDFLQCYLDYVTGMNQRIEKEQLNKS